MASAESPKPACPVCNQTDQVKKMQAAYNSGVTRCAPPDLPTRNVPMLAYMTTCILLVGICIFLVFTLIGGMENGLPQIYQLILGVVTLVVIVTSLAVSYYAFQRVVRGDQQAAEYYPAYDQAMATWNNLYYCLRDDVVFDPKSNKKVSNEQLAAIRAFSQASNQSETRSAVARH